MKKNQIPAKKIVDDLTKQGKLIQIPLENGMIGLIACDVDGTPRAGIEKLLYSEVVKRGYGEDKNNE